MQSKRRLILLGAAFAVVFGFLTITTPLVAANKEKVLYSFCAASGCADGQLPSGGLVFDAAGHLYGTTVYGGANGGAGTVFQLAPGANGTWTETVLYNFCSARQCTDGWSPYAGVIVDAVGNLYGTTYNGGAYGFGTVFQLAPGANGAWTEKVLYNFCAAQHCADGKAPSASLIFDAAGNLYGTTFFGGSAYDLGTVFQLAPGTNGRWTEKVLHRFGNGKDDGYWPDGSLIFDSAGTLYGITRQGGAHVYYGTVFQLVRGTNGKWSEKVLHSFNYDGKDGYYPGGSLVVDAAGNLYGTTPFGGPNGSGCDKYGCGTIFKLAPGTRGKWAETILHSFNDNFSGGHYPYAGLIFDAAGNLYGTSNAGGLGGCGGRRNQGCGTVFQLAPGTEDKWTYGVLYRRFGRYPHGRYPSAGVILDSAGNLYGMTSEGGVHHYGAVFEITP